MSSVTQDPASAPDRGRESGPLDPASQLFPAIVTLFAVVVAIIGAFFGSGAVGGGGVTESAGGWLDADATPIAPASSAFSIWSVVYLGLAAYAIWQLGRTARSSERQRRLRPWIAGSALLNAAWLGVVSLDTLIGSVLVILVLLLVLIRTLLLMMATRTSGWVETLLVDGTMGLYLGWVSVAVAANITAWLAGGVGLDDFEAWEVATVAIVTVAAVIAMALAFFTRGRLAPAAATAWGLAWIAVARTEGQFESQTLVWTAALASAAVVVAVVVARLRREQTAETV